MATIQVIFTHPNMTLTETLSLPDAKMLELIDLLRNREYPMVPDNSSPPVMQPISRQDAAKQYAQQMLKSPKDTYQRLKRQEDHAAVPPPPDLTDP